MANPNLGSATTIYANTAIANVTTTDTTFIQNTASSNTVVKINSILVSNIQENSTTANIGIERSSVKYYIVKDVTVPSGSTLDALSKSLYLLEGDALFVSGSANSAMQITSSYEEIS